MLAIAEQSISFTRWANIVPLPVECYPLPTLWGTAHMPARRQKKLHYLCAIWFQQGETLESYLRQALNELTTAEERTVEAGEDHFIRCLQARKHHGGGVSIHITADTPGESASTVPKQLNSADVNVGQAPPPPDSEYMDGDIFALIRDDHVCFCSGSGLMREGSLQRFLMRLFEQAELNNNAGSFVFKKIADAQKVAMIEAQGVKEVDLNASLYNAVTHYAGRTQHPMGVVRQAGVRLYNALLADDHEDRQDNLLLRVSIWADGRIKTNPEAGFQRLEEIARQIIETEQEGDSYTIVTQDDQRITEDELILQKTVSLPAVAKSVSRAAAWDELLIFFNELCADNSIVAP